MYLLIIFMEQLECGLFITVCDCHSILCTFSHSDCPLLFICLGIDWMCSTHWSNSCWKHLQPSLNSSWPIPHLSFFLSFVVTTALEHSNENWNLKSGVFFILFIYPFHLFFSHLNSFLQCTNNWDCWARAVFFFLNVLKIVYIHAYVHYFSQTLGILLQ